MVKHLGNRAHVIAVCHYMALTTNNWTVDIGLVWLKTRYSNPVNFSADSSNTFWTITYSFRRLIRLLLFLYYLPPPPPIWLRPFQAFQYNTRSTMDTEEMKKERKKQI